MFVKTALALATVASSVIAAPVARGEKQPPAGWATDYLEDYMTYHTRYLALYCYEKHDTQFFQDCCRPLLATESLDSRADQCKPSKERTAYVASSLSVKYSGAAPTAAPSSAEEQEECEVESSVVSEAAATPAYTPAAASSAAASSAAASPAAASPAAESQVGGQYRAAQPSSSSSTQPAWTPAPSPTQAPTTQAPAPQPTTQAPSGGESFSGGYATYFYQGGNPGACGQYHADSDYIVAIDYRRWGSSSFGGGSDTCGRQVRITNTQNGRSIQATIADVCPTCNNGNSLDLSVGAFQALSDLGAGMIPISWSWA